MSGLTLLTKVVVGEEFGAPAIDLAIGHTITKLRLASDNVMHMGFANGYQLQLSDEGQSCCETRYMTTDDDLQDFIGAALISVAVLDAPNIPVENEDDYGSDEHEVQFLRITTTKGDLTFASHNEHNGYYGGISLYARGEQA